MCLISRSEGRVNKDHHTTVTRRAERFSLCLDSELTLFSTKANRYKTNAIATSSTLSKIQVLFKPNFFSQFY